MNLDELRAFLFLYDSGNLTRAAASMGLSQPAMSRTLGRLRATFGDVLFVRTRSGISPTARASTLVEEVREILRRYEGLTRPAAFHPAVLQHTFRVGASDYAEVDFLPKLMRRLSKAAPRVQVVLRPATRESASQLELGELDVVVSPETVASGMIQQWLFDDGFVCVLRRGHPVLRGKLTLEKFISLDHILIAPRGTPGSAVDQVLSKMKLKRHVAVRCTSFMGAPLLASQSDMILTAPKRVIDAVGKSLDLVVRPVPIEIPRFRILMVSHPRTQHDPAQKWFREQLKRAVGS